MEDVKKEGRGSGLGSGVPEAEAENQDGSVLRAVGCRAPGFLLIHEALAKFYSSSFCLSFLIHEMGTILLIFCGQTKESYR